MVKVDLLNLMVDIPFDLASQEKHLNLRRGQKLR